ncbi:MAG: hypothetical protein EA396_02975 [Anaerolineaceae bacterium]|nr:MAG: hypothetical protein EA396_02975 [Anaerolineaceae bacterium]
MDRQVKVLIAVFFTVAAILLLTNHVVSGDDISEWGIAGLMLALSAGFWVWVRLDMSESAPSPAVDIDEMTADQLPRADDLIIPETTGEDDADDSQRNLQPMPSPFELEAAAKAKAEEEAKARAEAEAARAKAEEEAAAEAEAAKSEPQQAIEEAQEEAGPEPVETEEPEAEELPKTDKPTAPEPEPEVVDEPESAVEPAAEAEVPPTTAGGLQDLTRIEGIGPKYRDALIAAGVTTFAQLGEMSVERLVEIAEGAGMRRAASMETWAEQAQLAADRDWEALDKLQDKLNAGRRD